jgi:endonuclease/exonuclease/phosphatase family metal-dependent hydrolase
MFTLNAQSVYTIAFYNQENLFDTIDDPHKNDNEFLPDSKKEWNTQKYQNKLHNMARVIASMNDGKGPDMIGLCEVENDAVLNDLVKQESLQKASYHFAHFESPDERSIDNALLYNSKKLQPVYQVAYPVVFADAPNSKTRDILLVKLQSKNKSSIIVLVCHFPSRLGGQEASDHKRYTAASKLRQICDSITNASPQQAIVIMGDFNDEPNNKSIDSVLAAKHKPEETKSANDILNLMYDLKAQGMGSHFYKKEWSMLDQIMISQSMLAKGNVSYVPQSASIYKQDWMLETDEKYKGAPLRTFAGQKYLNGFSDHLPVMMQIKMK